MLVLSLRYHRFVALVLVSVKPLRKFIISGSTPVIVLRRGVDCPDFSENPEQTQEGSFS